MKHTLKRRTWLQHAATTGAFALTAPWAGPLLLPWAGPAGESRGAQPNSPGRRKLPVAGIVTVYTNNSHADVILGKIVAGYDQKGGVGPDLELVSLFTDQVPDGDLSRDLAKEHGFHLARTIDEALTLGGDRLQVAGVLSIGEHGTYPMTPDTKQHMYPRRRFFDEIVATFRRCGQSVPVFNDKHLGYRWEDASHMVQAAREVKFPLLAGSSVPVAWRYPPLDPPIGCQIEGMLTVGYGGLEAYGFHALEAHQCVIERRLGGETGVAAVQAVQGDAIWQAEKEGRWSRELLQAALATMPDFKEGAIEQRLTKDAAFYLLEHRDGLRSAVAMANGIAANFGTAVKLAGDSKPRASWFRLEEDKPFGHFGYLLRAIEEMIRTGQPSYPAERTLLTTGILDRVMHSLHRDGARLESPELAVTYQPSDWPFANKRKPG